MRSDSPDVRRGSPDVVRSGSPLFRLRGSLDARRPRSPDVRPGEWGGQGWLVGGASPDHARSPGGHKSPQRPRAKAVSEIVALSTIPRPEWGRGEVATADAAADYATRPLGEAGGSDLDLEAHLALARGAEVEFWHVSACGRQALLPSRLASSPVGPRVRSFAAAVDEGGAVAAMQPVGAGRLLCTADRSETLLLWSVGRRAVTRSLAVPLRAAALTTLRGQLACGAADGTPLPLEPEPLPSPRPLLIRIPPPTRKSSHTPLLTLQARCCCSSRRWANASPPSRTRPRAGWPPASTASAAKAATLVACRRARA